jgi:hypothetical protein
LKSLGEHYPEELTTGSIYYLDKRTVERFESAGVDSELLGLLRKALGRKQSVEIKFGNDGT